jgi:hypothetical protein
MRRILFALACAGIIVSAQAQVLTGAMLMPNPLGIVISIGQWIKFDGEPTYYIEVEGDGATPEEAKENGFRLAVEQAVGTIIASETESNNAHITRDEIISYSSGYVSKYEIVKQDASNLGSKITMRVWIKKSAIANRLLGESKTEGTVDGNQAVVTIRSIQKERADGDRLVATVLRDFPRRAFKIEAGKTIISMNNNRQAIMSIPITVKWDPNYLDSLWSALYETAQNRRSLCTGYTCENLAVIHGSQGTWAGWRGDLGFDDWNKYNQVFLAVIASQPAVLTTIYNERNDFVGNTCTYWNEFTLGGLSSTRGNNQIYLNGGYTLKSLISIQLTDAQLANSDHVKLEVVPGNICPKQ